MRIFVGIFMRILSPTPLSASKEFVGGILAAMMFQVTHPKETVHSGCAARFLGFTA